MSELPSNPPFAIRARLLSPRDDGGWLDEVDGLVEVGETGRITHTGRWPESAPPAESVDLRPMLVLPGLVDLHAHLPQLPNAGLGAGLDLLTWLDRYIFPLERAYGEHTATRTAPAAFRAFAAAGTTTVVAYAAIWPESTDVAFAAAEAHGIRAVIGKVMMDRLTYDAEIDPEEILETSLRQSDELATRWHGRDDGRLQYAFTPRFAVSCSADMLRESAALAERHGAYWQTHLSEDAAEIDEVRRLFPDARDYLDVYDRAGGVGKRTIFAHAIHLGKREVARLADSRASVAHCPASNLFLSSGMMPLGEYMRAGVRVGLGSDVAAGPEVSMFSVMRAGTITQRVLELTGRADRSLAVRPLEWLRLGTLDGAAVLGLADRIGSIERGKEADLIAIDPRMTTPLPGDEPRIASADDVISRLIFRPHPNMVRAAWVRGRLLAGPPGVDGIG
ncbi:MAG TPA: amidohydrolase family protein [Candidatus Limnocylindria bacterium]|nr:amidohydrolase family protein [Candidatus Limnocylindria bacterium]